MGQNTECAIDVLNSMYRYQLGISMRTYALGLPEEDDIFCMPSCFSNPNYLQSESDAFAGLQERFLGSEQLGDAFASVSVRRCALGASDDNDSLQNTEASSGLEDHDDETLHVPQGVQREHGEKPTLISTETLARMSTAIMSSFDSALKVLMVAVFFMLLGFCSLHARAEITETPENQVLWANTETTMKCKKERSGKPLLWVGFDHTGTPVSIFDGDRVNPDYQQFFSVTPNAGRYDLQCNATPQTALLFQCIEPGPKNIERMAELIVIESPPTIVEILNAPENNSNAEFIDLACTIELSGNWIPTMTWIVNGIQESLAFKDSVERLSGQRIRATSTLKNVLPKDRQKYICDVYFAWEKYDGKATTTNIPTFRYNSRVPSGLPPTLSAALPPETTDSYYNYFIGALSVSVCEAVIIIGFIVYTFKHNGILPWFKRDTRQGGALMNGIGHTAPPTELL